MKRWTQVVAAVLGAWCGAAHAELVDRVAAVVNNDIIPLTDVESRAAADLAKIATLPSPQARAEGREKVLKLALDSLIGEKLLEAEMKELNIDVSDAEVDNSIEDVKKQHNLDAAQFEQDLRSEGYSMATYREFMKKYVRRYKLIQLKVRSKVKVSDEDLRSEYQKWARTEQDEVELHARHILVKIPEKGTAADVEAARLKAVALAEEARKPGVDFAELAKAKSEGPSASDGGDLGFFRRGVMVPEFDKAAFALKVGEVSDPVRTKVGFHILKVDERRALPVKSFDAMKDDLRERVLREQLEKLTEQHVLELRQNALVEVKL